MVRKKFAKKVVIRRMARKASMGEKSIIMPGPPSGERCISRLMGDTIGSVNAESMLKILPIKPSGLKGIHVMITRIINMTTRKSPNI